MSTRWPAARASSYSASSSASVGWTGPGAARLAVSLLVWLVLPAAIGTVRVLRKEVS